MTPARRFAIGAILALAPLIAAWWFTADHLTATLRPIVGPIVGWLLPVDTLTSDGHGGWLVRTTLLATGGKSGGGLEIATFGISADGLRRVSLCGPLTLALLAAPPRGPRFGQRLALALAVLVVLIAGGDLAILFSAVTALVNHSPSFGNNTLPPVMVAAPRYSEAVVFISKLCQYVAQGFLPLLAPPALWLALNPAARALFFSPPEAAPHSNVTRRRVSD